MPSLLQGTHDCLKTEQILYANNIMAHTELVTDISKLMILLFGWEFCVHTPLHLWLIDRARPAIRTNAKY